MFEIAIQACADLARHVASRDFGFDGHGSKEAIRILHRERVIDEETAETLVAAVGFRNVLAHEYGTVDYAEVYHTLHHGLAVYDDFAQQLAQWYRDRA